MKKVLIVQRRMTHYRVPLFNIMREKLKTNNIELHVAYGVGEKSEIKKNDSADLIWGLKLKTVYFFDGRLCFQPVHKIYAESSLVIVALENKLICNLWHQFFKKNYKVALWGHGANLQGDKNSFREKWKRLVARRADWWFGYTEHSRELIEANGFNKSHVTILNNSIDTKKLNQMCDAALAGGVDKIRNKFGIHESADVGLFLGSLYAEKRLKFLFNAADLIYKNNNNFFLIIAGGGPDLSIVLDFVKNRPWAIYVGVVGGENKAELLVLSDLILNPGLIGLGILDSFVAGKPIVTTDCGVHSPEISYLKNGFNGVMVGNDVNLYADAVIDLLSDSELYERVCAGARISSLTYSIESMADNFCNGIIAALRCAPASE